MRYSFARAEAARPSRLRLRLLTFDKAASPRLVKLVADWDKTLREAFLRMVNDIRDTTTIDELSQLIERGQVADALSAAQVHYLRFANRINGAFLDSGNGAEGILAAAKVHVLFDQTNLRAVRFMQTNRLRVVQQLNEDQTGVIRNILTRGVQEGLNPRQLAREFRGSIGLTANQEAAVDNYRRLLGQNSSEALNRMLRDRRFDSTVTRAIERDTPLSSGQIDTMVDRYRERYLKYRSEVIARTEALPAVHEGANELFEQAIESGSIHRDSIQQEWNTKLDGRERDSHRTMNNQLRAFGQSFLSGEGHSLRYPGDPGAPLSETAQCRCIVTTRITKVA